MIPTTDGAYKLQNYLDLQPAYGSVRIADGVYNVYVHNKHGRWIFSGLLVDEWGGVPVTYNFKSNAP